MRSSGEVRQFAAPTICLSVETLDGCIQVNSNRTPAEKQS
jgi:hypothetical protein